ncbi:hypothetical protein EV182_001637, partial [Spiromyces aspiralis]
PQQRLGFKYYRLLLGLALGIAATHAIYTNYETARFGFQAMQRCLISGKITLLIGWDYYRNFPPLPSPDDPDVTDEERREIFSRRSAVHKRSAERVLEGMKRNGGVYIKLGQHLSAMGYVLPEEWTKTMRPLQDQCNPSSIKSIDALFRHDLGQSIDDMFEHFDPKPLGVASLAQVHRGVLRSNKMPVAVKVQHPRVREFAQIDMATVTVLFEVIHKAFPEFRFMWLSDEMHRSLPMELNFVLEKQNADEARWNFAQVENSCLYIPRVFAATERVLVMEYIEGRRADDLEYLKRHNISPWQVSQQLGKVFSEMIFNHGFVHCDPHPGNILIRAVDPRISGHGYPFDIVLLDHGLYRHLTPAFRAGYAQLWLALMRGDESAIRRYSKEIAGTDMYKFLASILTGQHWRDIADSSLSSKTRMAKFDLDAMVARTPRFFYNLSDILADMPRELVLLLKANDLLRLADQQLFREEPREVQSRAQLKMWANLTHYCLLAVLKDSLTQDNIAELVHKQEAAARGTTRKRTKVKRFFRQTMSYIQFWAMDWPLCIYIWWLDFKDWWFYFSHRSRPLAHTKLTGGNDESGNVATGDRQGEQQHPAKYLAHAA